MKTIAAFSCLLLLLLTGCDKDSNGIGKLYSARIVGFDQNCSTCIVSFPDDSAEIVKLSGGSPNNYYQIVNLNKGDFKVGQLLKVEVRKAEDTELNVCITMYPSFNYRNLYVLDYKEFNNLLINDTVDLAYKDCLYDSDRQSYICLDTVLSDSRCPDGVVCVWAGEAKARFKFEKYNNSPVFIDLKEGARDTVFNGYSISFIKLLPYPKYGLQTKPEDYKARIMIKSY